MLTVCIAWLLLSFLLSISLFNLLYWCLENKRTTHMTVHEYAFVPCPIVVHVNAFLWSYFFFELLSSYQLCRNKNYRWRHLLSPQQAAWGAEWQWWQPEQQEQRLLAYHAVEKEKINLLLSFSLFLSLFLSLSLSPFLSHNSNKFRCPIAVHVIFAVRNHRM